MKERQDARTARIAAAAIFACSVMFAGTTYGNGPAPGEEEVSTVSSFGSYLAGRFAERESDFSIAATLLDRVLEERPDDALLRQRAFLANLRAGNYERSVELAEAEIDNYPISLTHMTLAIKAVRDEDWDEASSMAGRIEVSGLARYAVPLMLAWIEAGRGDVDAATTALQALQDASGFAQLRRLHEGLIQANAGDYDAAIQTLQVTEEEYDRTPVLIMRTLAGLYVETGQPETAEQILTNYLKVNPGLRRIEEDLARIQDGEKTLSPITPAEGIAEGFYHLASSIRQQADELALIYGRMATFLDPQYDLAHLLIGMILEGRDRHGEAIRTFRQVDAESEYYWDARLSIADNLADMERDDEAMALLSDMADERPAATDPLVKLGYIHRAEKRYEDEIEVYNRAISRVDGDLEQRHWLLFYNRGIAYERSKQWPNAEADFLKALELKPDDPFVLNYLGYSWVEQGVNIAEAKEMIRKAVKQRQSDGYIVDSLGWVLYRIGEFQEAVAYLERAVQLRPQDPIINDHLGDAYWRVGRKNEARFQWDRALNLEPEEHLIEGIQEKLRLGLGEPEIIPLDN